MTEKTNKEGLYVHIPFCSSICSYCGFIKLFYESSLSDRYLDSMKEELKKYSSFSFDSLYLGGGTPSSLTLTQLKRLFDMLKPYESEKSYITIEVNPDITEDKIKLLSEEKVKRVSVGIQTFNKKYQDLINRHLTYEEAEKLISLFNKYGIDNINVDLIYGFEDETMEDLDKDLDLFLSLKVKHISTYCLQVEEGTILYNKNYKEAEDENAALQYEEIVKRLKEKGFDRYEVSNFARPGYESRHNLIYWNNHEYGSVGLSASSYLEGIRRTSTKSITRYLNNDFDDYEEVLTKEDEEFYFIMLGLRKEEGISLKEYKDIYNKDFNEAYKDKLKVLFDHEDLIQNGDRIHINPSKMFIMDSILRKLLF